MHCVICKGNLASGQINYPVNKDSQFLLIKEVPALICDQCGEYYLDDHIFSKIEKIVESAKQLNVEIEVLRFAA